jgi:hypothetical protein
MRKKLKTYRRQEVSLAVKSSGRRRGQCMYVVAFLAVTTVTELRAAAFGYMLVDRCGRIANHGVKSQSRASSGAACVCRGVSGRIDQDLSGNGI